MPCPQRPISSSGRILVRVVVPLGAVAARLELLEVACDRCGRRGVLLTDRLLAQHGYDLPMPELRRILAPDCPRMAAGQMHDPCGVRFPNLSRLGLTT